MSEHIVINGMLDNGYNVDQSEEIDNIEEIQEILAEAKLIEDKLEQINFLLSNEVMEEIIFNEAYELASSALYIENNGIAFELKDIDSKYSDEKNENCEDVVDDAQTLIVKSTVKNNNELN